MIGKISTDLSSVLPLDTRTARIAAGGGLGASLRERPAKKHVLRRGYRTGFEPDELDPIALCVAEIRAASDLAVPSASVQASPYPNSNPT